MSGSFREELVEPSSISISGVSINNWAREPGLPGVELSISARWVFGCYMNTEPIRVLAADDDALVREAYRSFFAAQPGIALVGQACDGQEVVEAFERILPDVTLIDLQMPVKSGIAATRQICAHWPRACVVVLTAFGTLEHIVAALKVGASGYLLKDAGLPALAAGIRQAARGEMPLSTAVRRQLVDSLAATRNPIEAVDVGLTAREREVLTHLAQGMTNQQISRQVYLCERSVKQCLADIGSKLGVMSRTQILVRAIQLGAVDPYGLPLAPPRR